MSKPDRSWIEESVRADNPLRNTDSAWTAVFAASYVEFSKGWKYEVGTDDHDRLIARCVAQADAATIGLRNWQHDEYAKKVERAAAERADEKASS